MAIKHAFTSAKPDGADATKVRASNWNADHTIENGTITDSHVAGANKDGTAGTASMRTLGTGAQQAAAGNHDHAAAYQPLDADLTAIAALSSNGLVERTGAGTAAIRAIGVAASTDVLTRADGDARYDSANVNRYSRIVIPPGLYTGGQASTRNLSDDSMSVVYMGAAPRAFSSATFSVCLRVTTAYTIGTGGTPWAEIAIATGAIVAGGTPTITPVAYADVIAIINSTGLKTITIPGVTLAAGAEWWIMLGNKLGAAASSSAQIRAMSIGDDLVVGQVGRIASFRPSSNIGTPSAVTVDANNAAPPWFTAVLPA